MQVGTDFGGDVGVLVRHVGELGHVVFLVKQLHRGIGTAVADAFPAALVECSLFETAFVEFPVEELVFLLGIWFASEKWGEADAGDGGRELGGGKLGCGGQPIGEGGWVIGDAGGEGAWPPGDEGYADAAIGEAAFDAGVGAGGLEAG